MRVIVGFSVELMMISGQNMTHLQHGGTHNCTHVLFVEIDHSLLESNVFGFIGFAKFLKNLPAKHKITSVTY